MKKMKICSYCNQPIDICICSEDRYFDDGEQEGREESVLFYKKGRGRRGRRRKCPPHSTTCQDKLNEVIASVAELEQALANAIHNISETLNHSRLTPSQLERRIEQLQDVIQLAIKKEIILQSILESAIEACEEQ